ncbi:MAG: hypothetical protein HY403_00430 [Elusimicrobia bacterium]|nr:hypothetical protein [Elusimicrobiota bacterium]
MDPKTKMPDIKAEVNKVDDGKKKAVGLLSGLFGGGASGGAGGLGGLGAGALATKTGMLALALMGSAVAGGIGLAGYKLFGPGDADRAGGNLSLFAPKPPQAASDGSAAAPANADGSSDSLNYMAQAAAKDKQADASAAAEAPSDAAATDPAKAAAAADAARRDAASGGALNSGGGAGAVGSMGKGLANVKKFGALSGVTGGGATSAASAGSSSTGDAAASAAKGGATSAFSRGGPGAKTSSSGRGVARRQGRGGRDDLRRVMGDQARGQARSSFAAGRTYDGAATNTGGAIGPDGGAIGLGGGGDGSAAQPRALAANSATQLNEQEPPMPKPKEMVTPWAQACQRAMMLVMLAAALAYGASKIPPMPNLKMILYAIGAAIMAIGAYIGVLAGQVMSGPYGQQSQGMVVAAAALGVIATGVGVMMGANKSSNADAVDNKPYADRELGHNALGGEGGKGLMANPMVMIGGGVAVVAAIGLMFMPKPKQVEIEEGQKKPDVRYEARPNPARYTV